MFAGFAWTRLQPSEAVPLLIREVQCTRFRYRCSALKQHYRPRCRCKLITACHRTPPHSFPPLPVYRNDSDQMGQPAGRVGTLPPPPLRTSEDLIRNVSITLAVIMAVIMIVKLMQERKVPLLVTQHSVADVLGARTFVFACYCFTAHAKSDWAIAVLLQDT